MQSEQRALAPAPKIILEMLGDRRVSTPVEQVPVAELDSDDAFRMAREWLVSPQGLNGESCDGVTYRTAARLKDFGISEDAAVEMLSAHEQAIGDVAEAEAFEQAIRNAYRYATERAPGVEVAKLPENEFVPVPGEDGEKPARIAPERTTRETSFDAPPSRNGPSWRMQSAAEFIADFVAPEYIIDGVARRGLLYTLTAPTGTGKTAVALYAAATIAQGQQFCDLSTEPGDVVFMAGENPDDVRARVIATLEHYQIDPATSRLHFIPGTFSIRKDMQLLKAAAAKLPNLVLVVVDTLAAYFDGDDDNSNAQMIDFAKVVRRITTWPSKPCVIMPAHPVKDVRKDNNVPRGGGAMVNEVDGNLTLWADDGVSVLHWQRKIRGSNFEPLTFEMQCYETPKVRDAKGRLMPTVVAKPVLTMRAAALANQSISTETRILQSIQTDPGLSDTKRAAQLGVSRTTMQRRIEDMQTRKWIKPKGRKRALTEQGKEALADGLSNILEDFQ